MRKFFPDDPVTRKFQHRDPITVSSNIHPVYSAPTRLFPSTYVVKELRLESSKLQCVSECPGTRYGDIGVHYRQIVYTFDHHFTAMTARFMDFAHANEHESPIGKFPKRLEATPAHFCSPRRRGAVTFITNLFCTVQHYKIVELHAIPKV